MSTQDRRYHRSDDAYAHSYGKALDRSRTVGVKYDRGDKRGQICVDDSAHSVFIALFYARCDTSPIAQQLSDTLVYDDVGIDRHTDS